jgi:hypothetical protein
VSPLLLIAALLIIWLPTGIWLERLVPHGAAARWYLVAGYSGLLGMILTTLFMQLLSFLNIPISLYNMSAVASIISLAALAAPQRWRASPVQSSTYRHRGPHTTIEQCFIAVCLALLASRLVALGIEAGTRPVWSWDAKQHWTKQAKVFFELRSAVPYVSLQQWLELGGKDVYTNMHPNYPIATPLLQAWTSIALGHWHDSAVNLLWPVMWVSLGLVFFGQARLAGASAIVAIAATYMVLSLPYLNIQVALSGYADLLLAACYLGAISALYGWSQSREHWQLILALVAGACCMLIKNEGFYWFLSLFPGILLVTVGLKKGLLSLAALAFSLLLLIWTLPSDMAIAGHTLEKISPGYRPDSWLPIYLSALVHDNWHHLVYLFLTSLMILPFLGHKQLPLAAVVLSAVCLYLALYLLTSNASGAVRFTSLNRVFLQLAPAIGFFTLTVYLAVDSRHPQNVQTGDG